MNALFGLVCMIIPIVGPLVLSGWIITQLWAQGDEEDPTKFPEFDFNHFTKYLKRGLWPFLVQLVAGLAVGFVVAIVIVVAAIVIIGLAKAVGEVAPILLLLMILIGTIAYAAVIIGVNLILVPLSLKATLTQDFGPAFDLTFIKDFLSKTWKDLLLCGLLLLVIGIVFGGIAFITFGIGAYVLMLLMPPVIFAWQHLQKQLYLIYLERGGVAISKSGELNDLPPAPPSL